MAVGLMRDPAADGADTAADVIDHGADADAGRLVAAMAAASTPAGCASVGLSPIRFTVSSTLQLLITWCVIALK